MYDKRKRKVNVYVAWESHWTFLSTLKVSVQSDKNITSPPMLKVTDSRWWAELHKDGRFLLNAQALYSYNWHLCCIFASRTNPIPILLLNQCVVYLCRCRLDNIFIIYVVYIPFTYLVWTEDYQILSFITTCSWVRMLMSAVGL